MADSVLHPTPATARLRRLATALSRPSDPRQDSSSSHRLRRGMLAAIGLIALAAGLFRIEVPAPWADEAATVLAVQRDWPGLWALLRGQDAPLLPFYVIAKLWAGLLGWLPTLVAVRTLSAVAAAGTAMVLFSLVARRLGVLPAVLSAAVLIGLPGFTRWAQDARPYAVLMLASAGAWLAWDTWRRPDERTDATRTLFVRWGHWLRTGWPTALLLGSSVMASLFAVFGWPAMIAADLSAPRRTRAQRWHRVRQDLFVMVAAGVAFCTPIWIGLTMGRGPQAAKTVTWSRVIDHLIQLFVVFPRPLLALPIGVLAVAGILVAFLPTRTLAVPARLTSAARMATMWAGVPLAGSLAIALVRPNLFRARYWVPVLAPSALLVVIGALALSRAVQLLIARATDRAPSRSAVLVALPGALATLLILGQFAVTIPAQSAVRDRKGHGVSVYVMIHRVDQILAGTPGQTLVTESGIVHAYLNAVRPDLARREIAYRPSPASSWVWPAAVPPADLTSQLTGTSKAVWVTLVGSVGKTPPTALPHAWDGTGLHIESAERCGSFWVMQLGRS